MELMIMAKELETDDEETKELNDTEVSDDVREEWRDKILGINNGKLLDYICELCQARRTIGRADENVTRKPSKKGEVPVPYPSYETPAKLKPIFQVESDNIDEMS
jgi:hypothetical protein